MINHPPSNLQAASIDEVIHSLDRVVEWAKENKHRCGYFAALYRKVTRRVQDGISAGEFQNGQRMEHLDVIFANRYFDAFENYHLKGQPTDCWRLAFETSEKWRPFVLQHLLLGMNAHIGLDLGFAAADTATDIDDLKSLKPDFDRINSILASLVNGVQDELAHIWPLLKHLDKAAGSIDERLTDHMMGIARSQAWDVAVKVLIAPAETRPSLLKTFDKNVAEMGRYLMPSGFIFQLLGLMIRLTELTSVNKIIEILE